LTFARICFVSVPNRGCENFIGVDYRQKEIASPLQEIETKTKVSRQRKNPQIIFIRVCLQKELISYLMHKNEEIRGKRLGQL
jgi:hypothetical protein